LRKVGLYETSVRSSLAILFTATALLTARPSLAQPDAAALLREGNDLVRSGVYRTALLRYREAAAAGLDTPLLHYNLGVAHYELAQFDDAAREFERAEADPALAVLAQYNKGLAERGAGNSAAADAAFAAAAERADDRGLRRLAERARESLVAAAEPAPSRTASPAVASRAARERPPVGELRLAAAARMGQDDNVYRAPAAPYVDLSNAAQPLVTPVVQAASFVPVDLAAAYVLHNEAGDTDFEFSYALDGDFYSGEFANADRIAQRFAIGADIVLGERELRRRALQTAFFVRDHDEKSFDPDTGVNREIDGDSIAERLGYAASGVEGRFDHRLGRWRWGFDMRFERREYEAVPTVANYDHDHSFTAVAIDYEFSDALTLSAGLRRYRRAYDEQPSRDLAGTLLSTNSPLEYDYRGVQLGLLRRLGPSIDLDVGYLRLDRLDRFLGYDDYTQDALRIRGVFRIGARLDVSLAALGRTYDYPNAFAFNEPTAGALEHDETAVQAAGHFRLNRHWSLFAELTALDVTSTDARAAYTRTQAQLGAEWRR
jgi:hypothetical protein